MSCPSHLFAGSNLIAYSYTVPAAWFSLIVVTHIIESFAVALYATYFGCKKRPRLPIKALEVSAETKWRLCCKCCCTASSILTCCVAGGKDSHGSDFSEIALILADYFDGGGIVDVVLSDIVVGFKMLAREQKQREISQRRDLVLNITQVQSTAKAMRDDGVDEELGEEHRVTEDVRPQPDGEDDEYTDNYLPTGGMQLLSKEDASDKYVLAEGARFMRYAQGVYCFRLYSYPGERMVKACSTAVDDAIDTFTERRLLRDCDLFPDSTEIVYAQFLEGLAKTPYGIFIDHAWKTVVVSIRGTMSLDDVVADLTITPASMEEWGARCGFEGHNYFVHAGILTCVEWIYNDLER